MKQKHISKIIKEIEKTKKVFVGKLNKAYYCDALIYQDRLSKLIKKGKKKNIKDMFFEEEDIFICLYGYK